MNSGHFGDHLNNIIIKERITQKTSVEMTTKRDLCEMKYILLNELLMVICLFKYNIVT